MKVVAVLMCVLLLCVGCKALEHAFTPDPVTGISPAQEAGETVNTIVSGSPAGPWGEIILGTIMLIQNGFLFYRRMRRRAAS